MILFSKSNLCIVEVSLILSGNHQLRHTILVVTVNENFGGLKSISGGLLSVPKVLSCEFEIKAQDIHTSGFLVS